MVMDSIASDVAVWGITFALGGIVSWLVWLTIRHYNYGKPAYEALADSDMGQGHLTETSDRFDDMESSHTELRNRVANVEEKVDDVNTKTDRNYRLLSKIADKAGIESIFFRDGGTKPERADD